MRVTAADVVMVHSYHLAYPWTQEYRQGFFDVFPAKNVAEFEMDTKRLNPLQFQQRADEALQFIQTQSPKLVVLADDNALQYIGPTLAQKGIPFVFLGINANPRNYISLDPTKQTGVLERPLLKRSVTMLRELIPSIQRVKVMMDAGETSKAILQTSFEDKISQTIRGIQVDTELHQYYEDWLTSVEASKTQGYDAIIIANYAALKTANYETPTLDNVSIDSARLSKVPIFSFWRYSIGVDKAIGGLVISGFEQGQSAAKQVKTFLLDGAMPQIQTPTQGKLIFSESALARWHLTLPPSLIARSEVLP